jgi:hypothetical protein
MKNYRSLIIAAAGAAALLLGPSTARAQEIEEKLTLTFSKPVEVPGEVLPAGTYIFQVLKQGSLTRILSPDELHVYATLLTVPEEKKESEDGATVIMKKNEDGPERIDAWFFPGDSVGNEFVYHKPSHKSVEGVIESPGKKVGHATEKGAKDVAVATEHIGAHAAHAGEDVGLGVYHAGKYLVT